MEQGGETVWERAGGQEGNGSVKESGAGLKGSWGMGGCAERGCEISSRAGYFSTLNSSHALLQGLGLEQHQDAGGKGSIDAVTPGKARVVGWRHRGCQRDQQKGRGLQSEMKALSHL